jgi:two-component system nitrogen regulation response regulator GlnG
MPAELQTRLLRVLSDGEYYPVGATASVKVDVRIIAATHQNLENLVAEGRFREDLFHRLNVIRIHIPPLRERSQDIPLLMRYFLTQAANELSTEIKILRPETEAFLMTLSWPGNVRQLENTCRWLTVMASGREIYLNDLPQELHQSSAEKNAVTDKRDWQLLLAELITQQLLAGKAEIARDVIAEVESIMIKAALTHSVGKRYEAALLLGYGRNTLTRKIQELNLDK